MRYTKWVDFGPAVSVVFIAGVALIGPLGLLLGPLGGTREPLPAAYTVPYERTSAWLDVPNYDVIDVLGGSVLSGFIVIADNVADDPQIQRTAPTVRLSVFKETQKKIREHFVDYLDPAPPLPFAVMSTAVLRRVDGQGNANYGTSSEKVFLGSPKILHCRNVPAWRLTIHPWAASKTPGLDPWFYRVLDARPLERVHGKLIPACVETSAACRAVC